MPRPEVSVVIPAYNAEAYIVPAVLSCIKQNAPGISHEVVVVNDGSTDATAAVLENLQKQTSPGMLRVVEQDNQGEAAALNTGVDTATGNHIVFCDSDDLLGPHAIDALNTALYTHHVATGDYAGFSLTPDGTPTILYRTDKRQFTRVTGDPKIIPLLHGNVVGAPRAVRKRDYEFVGGSNTKMRFADDFDMILKILCPQGGPILPWTVTANGDILYWYRHHPTQETAKTDHREIPLQITLFEQALTNALDRLGISQEARFIGRHAVGYLWAEHVSTSKTAQSPVRDSSTLHLASAVLS